VKGLPAAKPATYQDVKVNLAWYTVVMLVILWLAAYFLVLPAGHQVAVRTLFGSLSLEVLGTTLATLLLGFAGVVLVFGFEFHDKIYDRYIIRWREKYDLETILPTLVEPFLHKVDSRFLPVASETRKNRYVFMKIFYHFVMDYAHPHKIKENLIIRFYEAVQKYWWTQVNEIFLVLLFLTSLAYLTYGWRVGSSLARVWIALGIFAVLFLLNRVWIRGTRCSVEQATLDEIADIHETFPTELEEQIKAVHGRYKLAYGSDED